MATCSASYTPSDRARLRLVAAGAASVLAHILAGATLTARAPGPPAGAALTRSLTAQLLLPEASLPSVVLPGISDAVRPDAVPSKTRVLERQPVPAVSSRTPASAEAMATASMPPQLQDPTYYAARQLDVYPTLVSALNLRDVQQASAVGLAGRAVALLLIDEKGLVNAVEIVSAEPEGALEVAVRSGFMDAQFTPALKAGRAVRSRLLVHVDYGGPMMPKPTRP